MNPSPAAPHVFHPSAASRHLYSLPAAEVARLDANQCRAILSSLGVSEPDKDDEKAKKQVSMISSALHSGDRSKLAELEFDIAGGIKLTPHINQTHPNSQVNKHKSRDNMLQKRHQDAVCLTADKDQSHTNLSDNDDDNDNNNNNNNKDNVLQKRNYNLIGIICIACKRRQSRIGCLYKMCKWCCNNHLYECAVHSTGKNQLNSPAYLNEKNSELKKNNTTTTTSTAYTKAIEANASKMTKGTKDYTFLDSVLMQQQDQEQQQSLLPSLVLQNNKYHNNSITDESEEDNLTARHTSLNLASSSTNPHHNGNNGNMNTTSTTSSNSAFLVPPITITASETARLISIVQKESQRALIKQTERVQSSDKECEEIVDEAMERYLWNSKRTMELFNGEAIDNLHTDSGSGRSLEKDNHNSPNTVNHALYENEEERLHDMRKLLDRLNAYTPRPDIDNSKIVDGSPSDHIFNYWCPQDDHMIDMIHGCRTKAEIEKCTDYCLDRFQKDVEAIKRKLKRKLDCNTGYRKGAIQENDDISGYENLIVEMEAGIRQMKKLKSLSSSGNVRSIMSELRYKDPSRISVFIKHGSVKLDSKCLVELLPSTDNAVSVTQL